MSRRDPEPWVSYPALEQHFDVSHRWLEYRLAEGMPSAIIAGRRKFKLAEVERWLKREGHLVEGGDR